MPLTDRDTLYKEPTDEALLKELDIAPEDGEQIAAVGRLVVGYRAPHNHDCPECGSVTDCHDSECTDPDVLPCSKHASVKTAAGKYPVSIHGQFELIDSNTGLVIDIEDMNQDTADYRNDRLLNSESANLQWKRVEKSKKTASKCKGCGKEMNPVEVMVAGENGVCKKCVDKKHKEVTGAEEELGDVWELESKEEKYALEELQLDYIDPAMEGDTEAQEYLSKLWDGESWESIKKKLETEGSTWYVWFMDGVRAYMNLKGQEKSVTGGKVGGWSARVQEVYDSLEDLKNWDENYKIVSTLGYDSAEELWEANPVISGSNDPNDFRVVKSGKHKEVTGAMGEEESRRITSQFYRGFSGTDMLVMKDESSFVKKGDILSIEDIGVVPGWISGPYDSVQLSHEFGDPNQWAEGGLVMPGEDSPELEAYYNRKEIGEDQWQLSYIKENLEDGTYKILGHGAERIKKQIISFVTSLEEPEEDEEYTVKAPVDKREGDTLTYTYSLKKRADQYTIGGKTYEVTFESKDSWEYEVTGPHGEELDPAEYEYVRKFIDKDIREGSVKTATPREVMRIISDFIVSSENEEEGALDGKLEELVREYGDQTVKAAVKLGMIAGEISGATLELLNTIVAEMLDQGIYQQYQQGVGDTRSEEQKRREGSVKTAGMLVGDEVKVVMKYDGRIEDGEIVEFYTKNKNADALVKLYTAAPGHVDVILPDLPGSKPPWKVREAAYENYQDYCQKCRKWFSGHEEKCPGCGNPLGYEQKVVSKRNPHHRGYDLPETTKDEEEWLEKQHEKEQKLVQQGAGEGLEKGERLRMIEDHFRGHSGAIAWAKKTYNRSYKKFQDNEEAWIDVVDGLMDLTGCTERMANQWYDRFQSEIDSDVFSYPKTAGDGLDITPEAYMDRIMTAPGSSRDIALDRTIKHFRGRIPADQLFDRLHSRYASFFSELRNLVKQAGSDDSGVEEVKKVLLLSPLAKGLASKEFDDLAKSLVGYVTRKGVSGPLKDNWLELEDYAKSILKQNPGLSFESLVDKINPFISGGKLSPALKGILLGIYTNSKRKSSVKTADEAVEVGKDNKKETTDVEQCHSTTCKHWDKSYKNGCVLKNVGVTEKADCAFYEEKDVPLTGMPDTGGLPSTTVTPEP